MSCCHLFRSDISFYNIPTAQVHPQQQIWGDIKTRWIISSTTLTRSNCWSCVHTGKKRVILFSLSLLRWRDLCHTSECSKAKSSEEINRPPEKKTRLGSPRIGSLVCECIEWIERLWIIYCLLVFFFLKKRITFISFLPKEVKRLKDAEANLIFRVNMLPRRQ